MARSNLCRPFRIAAFFTLAFISPVLALSPALAAQIPKSAVTGTADYVITLGGFNLAHARVKLTDADNHFNITLKAQVTALANLVASGTADIKASGTSTPTSLTSEAFDLLTKANGDTFSITVGYRDGNVDAFKIAPPLANGPDRIPIERDQLTGVTDMLSAFVFKGGTLAPKLCDRRLRIFTGVERFDIAMSYLANDTATSLRTGYQGPVVQCHIKYTPISGHFTTSGMTNYLAASDHILIWYAPMGTTGYFVPYRVLVGTSFGDLSMVLTKLTD